MKGLRTIGVVCALLLVSYWAHAQRGINVGVTAIFSNSWILDQNNFETLDGCDAIARSEMAYRFTFGYSAGLTYGYNFNKRLGLQSAIYYSRAGQKYDDTFHPGASCPDPYHVVRNVDLRYLQFPLQLKVKFNAGKKFRMYTLLGPQFGTLLAASERVIINDVERTDLTDPDDKFHKFDWGVTLGAGTEFFFTESLYANFGFITYYAISDLNGDKIKDVEWFSKNDVKYRSSHNFRVGLSIGVHYLFNMQNPFGGDKKNEAPVVPGQTN